MKKTTSVILTILTLFALCVNAFAADTVETDNGTSTQTVNARLNKNEGILSNTIYVEITWTPSEDNGDIIAAGANYKWDGENCKYVVDGEEPSASGSLEYEIGITNKSSCLIYYCVTYGTADDSPFTSELTTSDQITNGSVASPVDGVTVNTFTTDEFAGEEKSTDFKVTVGVTGISDADGVNEAADGGTQSLGTLTCTITTKPSGDCLAAGTKITMADGTLKNVEDVVEGDLVLTFNHEKAVYEPQAVYLAWECETPKRAFTLCFTNDIRISVIGDHSFFEKESISYVAIFEYNAETFIGKHFYNATEGRYEELLGVTYETEPVAYYEIYTEYNANCIAEKMLNVAYDTSELLNIYRFNEDLSIDHEQLERDIAQYGLYAYPENATFSEELYDALGWKYANVMVGKGFGTWEEFFARRDAFLAER